MSTYSPDGRIFQVEYANKAVETGGVAIALKCRDGVVLGVEKLFRSRLVVEGTNRRIFTVNPKLGLGFVGWEADGRPLAEVAQKECIEYRETFGVDLPPHLLADRLAQYMHAYTCYGSHRPWGVSLLVLGYDDVAQDCFVHLVEPSGHSYRARAASAGKARPAVKTEIEKLDLDALTVRQALGEIARIVRLVNESEQENKFELEMSWICQESGWKHAQVSNQDKLQASEWAKAKLDQMDEEEEE